jgi:hypothetical protein
VNRYVTPSSRSHANLERNCIKEGSARTQMEYDTTSGGGDPLLIRRHEKYKILRLFQQFKVKRINSSRNICHSMLFSFLFS